MSNSWLCSGLPTVCEAYSFVGIWSKDSWSTLWGSEPYVDTEREYPILILVCIDVNALLYWNVFSTHFWLHPLVTASIWSTSSLQVSQKAGSRHHGWLVAIYHVIIVVNIRGPNTSLSHSFSFWWNSHVIIVVNIRWPTDLSLSLITSSRTKDLKSSLDSNQL